MHPKNPGFTGRFIQLLDEHELSGNEISRRMKMNIGAVCKLRSGASQPTLETLVRLALVLELRPKEVLFLLGLETVDGKLRRLNVERS